MERLVEIEIESWAKFNPRADRANYTWFRLDNLFFHDQLVFGLTPQDQLSYIFVLCEVSKKNTARVSVDIYYAAAMLKMLAGEFTESLKRLSNSKLITLPNDGKKTARRRHKDGTLPSSRLATNVRDETYETNVTDERICATDVARAPRSPLPELAQIWNQNSGTLPKVLSCHPTSMRRKHAELRFKEQPNATLWVEVLAKIQESDFLMGRMANSTWRASFDWFIRPDTASKVLEGKYVNGHKHYPVQAPPRAPTQEIKCEHCDGFGNVRLYSPSATLTSDTTYCACDACDNGKKRTTILTSAAWARKHGYVTHEEFRAKRPTAQQHLPQNEEEKGA